MNGYKQNIRELAIEDSMVNSLFLIKLTRKLNLRFKFSTFHTLFFSGKTHLYQ